jgi:hypothetical protein
MNERRRAYTLVCILLLSSCLPLWNVAASTNFSTTISFQESIYGDLSDGGSVFSPANPTFELVVSNLTNTTVINTEYELSNSTSTQVYNYTTNVTIPSNHSSTFDLRYRTNTTSGLESWKSLEVVVDADVPVISLSSINGSPIRYSQNQSIFVVSSNQPLEFQCGDLISGVQYFHGSIGNASLASINNSITVTDQTFTNQTNQPQQIDLNMFCLDNVGNNRSSTFTLILDDEIPQLITTESGTRIGNCASEDWKLWPSATDNHSTASVQIWSQSSWSTASSSISPDRNSTGSNITLRAVDSSGFASPSQSWLVSVDTSPPSMSTTLNSTELSISAYDNCTSTNLQVMWETILGQSSGWTTYQNSTLVIPVPFNGSIVRAKIKATDMFGNENQFTSGWVSTNGSLPSSVVVLQNDHFGNISNNSVSLRITPTGYLANSTFEFYINNQLNFSGYTTSQVILNRSLAHGDDFTLFINTSNGYGGYRNQNYSYTVDNSNGHVLPITLSGQSLNTTSLLLGPTGRLTPAAASDDNAGVGGDYVSCTWDASTWFQSTAGFNYAPSTSSGSVQAFVFGCRSVDYLGNEGPITWVNGSVDLETPSLTLQPAASETIGLNTSLVVNASDSNGIASTQLNLEWSNGSSTLYSNLSLGTSNWTSTLGQLFTGLSDGTVTATVVTTDQLGNTNTISSRSWTLNTSSPFITTALSGTYYNQFITNDSTGITLTLPSGGWSGLWVAYTFVDSSGSTILSGNVSSSTLLEPADLVEGTAWLNTTTGDALGRIQVQSWIYTVDNSNGHVLPITLSGQSLNTTSLLLGPTGRLTPAAASDDNAGVGGDYVSCTWDASTWFQSTAGFNYAPSTSSGSVQAFVFGCRSVDYLGNEGPITWVNGSVDLETPSLTLQPAASETIGLNTSLVVNASDSNGIASTQLNLEWSNGSSTLYSNLSLGTSNWTSTLGQLFTGLSDGTVTATVVTTDQLGNTNTISSRSWTLNTSSPFITTALSGTYYNQFITNDSTGITLTLPSGGWSGLWVAYTFVDSSGSTILSGNVSSSTLLEPADLVEGTAWLNTTTGDALGRIQVQSWIYTVDNSNGHVLPITLSGQSLNTTSLLLGPTGRLTPAAASDDNAGVGGDYVSCTWDASTWFQSTAGFNYAPSTSSGSVQAFVFGCRSVDYLGNEGPITWVNGSVDLETPSLTLQPAASETIGLNTSLVVNASDSNGIASTQLNLEWSNGSSTLYSNLSLGTSNWTSTLGQLFTGLSDGTVTATVVTTDQLGNTNTISSRSWTLNTSSPFITTALSGTYYNQFITNDSTGITLTLPSGGWSGLWVAYTFVDSSGSTILSGNVSSSTLLEPADLVEGTAWLNTTTGDALGRIQVQSWIYTVDNSNGHVLPITLSGQSLNTTSLLLGPTGRLTPAAASDDNAGVGGDYVSCTWDASTWFQSTAGFNYAPSTSSGSVQAFVFGCRSVDYLGNEGPITWVNGSVDLETPSLTLQPAASETIGLNTSLVVNASDSNGIASTQLNLEWSNGSSTLYSNLSLGTSNWTSTLGQLFTGLSDGTVTATVVTTDQLGNTNTISSRSWTLNTSSPFITTALSGTYYNQFITNDSTGITLTLPSGGWSGLWVAYTFVDSSGSTILSGNVSSSTLLEPADLVEGTAWLNTTTGDALGRIQVQSWIYTVDNSNGHVLPITLSGQSLNTTSLLLGPTGRLTPAAASDDNAGVGGDYVSCTWDASTWFQSTAGFNYAPSTSSGSVQAFVFGCRSVDYLGNEGPITWVNGSVDLETPSLTLQPAASETIGLNTSLVVNASDSNGIASTQLNLEWSNGSSTLYSNLSLGTSNWTSTLGQLFTGLSDGTVTATVVTTDQLGNTNTISSRSWTLNTSSPFITTALSGTYYNQFITNDSTGITLTLPSGGWSGLWVAYTFVDSSGSTILSGNVSSSTLLEPADLVEGTAWLNTTTGDALGRIQVQSWIYTVDNSNGHVLPITLSGQSLNTTSLLLGPTGRLTPAAASDDNAGVGGDYVSCTWDASTWFQSTAGFNYAPSTSSGSVQAFVFGCRSVDYLGNEGPITWVNGSVDLETPSLTLQPAASETIGLNTSLVVNASDSNGIASTQLNLEWSNGSSTLYSNLSLGTSNWTSTLGQLFTGLSDGTVTATVVTTDQLGNTNTISSRSWTLNTSSPFITTALSGTYYNQFITNDSTGITLTLPSGGWSGLWVAYTFVDSSGSTILSGNVSSSTLLEPADLVEGTAWLNTTTGDALGRIQVQSWIYTVDNSNGHVLPITLSGQSLNTTSLLLGPTGRLTPAAASDDNAGVGGDYVSCTWDASTWFQSTAGFNYAPSTSSGSVQAFVFGCRSVDYLGNEGPITWVNGSVDLETPSLTLQPAASETIGLNTSLVVNASDSNGIASTQLNLEWSNGSSTLYSNLSLGTSNWTSTLGQLFTGLSDGTVTATVVTTDQLGNTNTISSRSWTLNTSSPFITTALSGTYYNQFITNDSTGITLTLPSGGWSGLWVAYTFVDSSGSTILSGNVSSSTLLEPADLVEGTAWLNTTTGDALGRIQVQSWIYTVDNSNGHVLPITLSGQSLNTTSLLLGPTVV